MSVSSSFPSSPQQTYDFYELIDRINDVIVRLSKKTGIRLKEVGKGMGTDMMEEAMLDRYVPDLKPVRPGVQCCFEQDDGMPDGHFSHVTCVYTGLTKDQSKEFATRMGRALGLPEGIIKPVHEVENHVLWRYGVEIPGKIFVERIIPEILASIEQLAETPEILKCYSVTGKGTRFRPIEEEYAEKLDHALGTNFCDREQRGLYPYGIISIQALEGIRYSGDQRTREDIHALREPIWDALARVRDLAGISKDDVPISGHPGHTADLAIEIRDIQKYEGMHGPNSFFNALAEHRESFLQDMRRLNPHVIAADSRGSGRDHGAPGPQGQ